MEGYDKTICNICGQTALCIRGICEYCHKYINHIVGIGESGDFDEPIFYECAMCGMEVVTYEIVRGNKYCHSCAAIERHG